MQAVASAPVATGNRQWTVFLSALVVVLAAVVLFVAWLYFRFGGDSVTVAVDDIGEAVAAFAAAASCRVAADRSRDNLRRAWSLLAISAVSWGLGETVWSVYEVGLGVSVPFPSLADLGYLGAIPFAIAGILAFSQAPRGTSTGIRLWADRAIVALCLLFVAWGLGLEQVYTSSGSTLFARLLGLAYPVGDILIGTVLILSIRRATQQQYGRFMLLLAGLAANSLSDSAFAYLTANGLYGSGSYLDAGWLAGYLMVALAALWPADSADQPADDEPIDLWQLALPWLGVLAVGVTVIVRAFLGDTLDTPLMLLAGLLAVLLFVTQTFAHRESLKLLVQARLIASTLNDVVVHAPLGIIRLSPTRTVIQANPRAAVLLGRDEGALIGSSIDEYFAAAESVLIHQQLFLLSKRGGAAEFDTESRRRTGTPIFVHWSVTAVVATDGRLEYFIAMLEDVSARREAALTAVSNLAALERLNRIKTDFLTRVRHEFRTALVGIQGFSELMKDARDLDVEEVRSFADDIYRDARRLDGALNDMLALDRSETGRMSVHVEEVDINELVAGVVAAIAANDRSHVIKLALGDLGRPVAGDRTRLGQVVGLLIDNAIEHSPSGAVITVSTIAAPGRVEAVIAEERAASGAEAPGVSMPEATASRRADGLPEAVQPVAELGPDIAFSVARQIVEMHGGRIWFEKTAAAGVECHLELPLVGGTGTRAAAAPGRLYPDAWNADAGRP